MNTSITSISVNSIVNAVNNPRKAFGDLSELRDSIAKNGILQPISVVKEEDHYKVIMGHRRLEAARLAGLEEVPCIVQEWDDSEQVGIMMMENMMRENLSTYEEAKGFQMMMDLGKSVEAIAEETGFSQSTVRSRTKLLSLDEDKFKASVARGATLQELTKLYEIEDEHTRNAVLKFAGTSDFNSKVQKAINEEDRERKLTAAVQSISEWATKIESANLVNGVPTQMHRVDAYYIWSGDKIPEKREGEFYFTVDSYSVTVYEKGEDTAVAKAEAERAERMKVEYFLKETALSAYNLRLEFVRNFGNFRRYGKTIVTELLKTVAEDMTRSCWRSPVFDNLCSIAQVEDADGLFENSNERAALLMLMAYRDSASANTWNSHWVNGGYEYQYERNEKLESWYTFLSSIGYRISEDEYKLLNGEVEHVIHREIPAEVTDETEEETADIA